MQQITGNNIFSNLLFSTDTRLCKCTEVWQIYRPTYDISIKDGEMQLNELKRAIRINSTWYMIVNVCPVKQQLTLRTNDGLMLTKFKNGLLKNCNAT